MKATSIDGTRVTFEDGHRARIRIRKLTPRECFRLQDVDDSDIDMMQSAGISESQQYKLAGNSITVGVFSAILEQIFFPKHHEEKTPDIKPKKAKTQDTELYLFNPETI